MDEIVSEVKAAITYVLQLAKKRGSRYAIKSQFEMDINYIASVPALQLGSQCLEFLPAVFLLQIISAIIYYRYLFFLTMVIFIEEKI